MYLDSTEDDWIAQKQSDILQSPNLLNSRYSSPILLGKYDSRMNITQFSITEEQFDYQESYELNNYLPEQNFDLEELLKFTPISIQKKRIGKRKKSKIVKNKEQQCHNLVQDMMKITKNKEEAWIQLKQCQQGKQFIDQLERVLLSMKSIILKNIQIRQSQ